VLTQQIALALLTNDICQAGTRQARQHQAVEVKLGVLDGKERLQLAAWASERYGIRATRDLRS
jgi:hypothetical protein